jgi:hypothetical protein
MMTTTTAATATTATATTTTATTVAAVTVQQAIALGALATAILIGLLVVKELLLAYSMESRVHGTWKARVANVYAANLNIAILPLMAIFGLIVVTKVAAVL